MKAFALSATILMSLSATFNAQASAEDTEKKEAIERELAFQLAPIKSSSDLRAYLTSDRHGGSPLNLLSPGGRQRFLQSLVFTRSGLASFDYRDIAAELTPTQAYQLLSLFGAQRTTSTIPGFRIESVADSMVMLAGENVTIMVDYQDHWCSSPATCDRRTGSICIGDRCGNIEP